MSLILKSNKKASVKFPNASTVNTSAALEFSKYSARVVADGGRIVDTALTLKAFQNLFDNGFYGNVNSWVGGSFGVKTDSEGRILKLYAIDGYDVVGKVYGSGELPLLQENGVIDFTSNSKADKVNGAILTTEQPIRVSKNNDFGLGMVIDYTDASTTTFYKDSVPAAITTHGETAFGHTGVVASIYLGELSKNNPTTYLRTAKHPLQVGSNDFNNGVLVANARGTVSFHVTPNNTAQTAGYNGHYLNTLYPNEVAYPDLEPPIANASDYKFYLDFGGEDKGESGRNFYHGKAKEFFSVSTVGTNPDGSPIDIDYMASIVR